MLICLLPWGNREHFYLVLLPGQESPGSVCKPFWQPCPVFVSLSTATTNRCCWGVVVDVLPFKTPSCHRDKPLPEDGSSWSGLTRGPVAMESWWNLVCFSPASVMPGVPRGLFCTSCVAGLWLAWPGFSCGQNLINWSAADNIKTFVWCVNSDRQASTINDTVSFDNKVVLGEENTVVTRLGMCFI